MSSAATKPIVVGIDGSEQAEDAALWAVDEAVARGARLRLVYVVRTDLTGTVPAQEYRTALEDAKLALHSACSEVAATGRHVDLSSEVATGSPAGVLLAESRDASMICVGASGMGRVGRAMLGSTAAMVAERAECPVAVVHASHERSAEPRTHWVLVPVSVYAADNEDVIAAAIHEARLRDRPVLAVGVRRDDLGDTPYDALESVVSEWQQRFPDVHFYSVASGTSMARFLRDHRELAGVVIVESEASSDVVSTLGGGGDAADSERAVLVARACSDWRSTPSAAMRY